MLTLLTVGLTATVTASRLVGPQLVEALRRDPPALLSGQVWRLLSPVLVQTDPSTLVVAGVFVGCLVVGTLAEQLFTRRRWIVLYLAGALTGHTIGELFQPYQGGTSVAFAALLGGCAAVALRPRARVPIPLRVQAALLIPLAVVDTVVKDIHGLPFLVGLGVAVFWLSRDERRKRLIQPADPAPPVDVSSS